MCKDHHWSIAAVVLNQSGKSIAAKIFSMTCRKSEHALRGHIYICISEYTAVQKQHAL